MKIYIDVIFVENVFINYIIFLITSYILKINIKHFRIFIASILGSLYVIAFLIGIVPVFSNAFLKFFLSNIMVFIAFNPHSFKAFLKDLNVFYLVTFAIGGVAFAFVYMFNNKFLIIKNGFLIGFNSFKVSVLACIVGFIILSISFLYKKELIKSQTLICKISLFNKLKKVDTTCFIDSGNILKDPVTHKSVIIVEKSIIEKIIDFNSFNDFMLVPFNTIGNSNGLLLCVNVDLVKIMRSGQKDVLIKNAIIGIFNKTFSKNYHALIGIDLLQGDYSNELNSVNKENISWFI